MVESWAPMSTFCLIYWNWIEANWIYLELKTLVLILILPLTFCVTLGKSLSSSEFSVLICKMDLHLIMAKISPSFKKSTKSSNN